jgi:hypothetical protein
LRTILFLIVFLQGIVPTESLAAKKRRLGTTLSLTELFTETSPKISRTDSHTNFASKDLPQTGLPTLPPELLVQIAQLLTQKDKIQLYQVCKTFKDLVPETLNHLNLSGQELTEDLMKTLFNEEGLFRCIHSLDLSSSQLNHEPLNFLPKNIKNLNLSNTKLTNQAIQNLSNYHSLRQLDLSKNDLRKGKIASIYVLGEISLTHLSLAHNNLKNFEPLAGQVLGQLKTLKSLNLSTTEISLSFIQTISEVLPQLESLDLSGNPDLFDLKSPGLFILLKKLPHLQSLTLENSSLTQAGLDELAKLTQLKSIDFSKSTAFSTSFGTQNQPSHWTYREGSLQILSDLKELETLRLNSTNLTLKAIDELIALHANGSLTHLKHLELLNNPLDQHDLLKLTYSPLGEQLTTLKSSLTCSPDPISDSQFGPLIPLPDTHLLNRF